MSFFQDSGEPDFQGGPDGVEDNRPPEIDLNRAIETIKAGLLLLALTPQGSKATKKASETASRIGDKDDPLPQALTSILSEMTGFWIGSFFAARCLRGLHQSGYKPTARNLRRAVYLATFVTDRVAASGNGAIRRNNKLSDLLKAAGADNA